MRRIRKLARFFIVVASLFFFSPVFAEPSTTDIPQVRVLVAEGRKIVNVSVKGRYLIRSLPGYSVLKKGERLVRVALRPTAQGVRLGDQEIAGRGISIEPEKDGDLFINQSRFRGRLDFLKDQSGTLYAINNLGIERYLYGVLHYEVGSWWPMEAIKAQAVAARTYALYQASVSRSREYDLKNSTSSQVYGGSSSERYRSKAAVDQTAGKVLLLSGKLFPAYFHSVCAGITAAASELWKIEGRPIDGGVQCGYCRISPHYHWHASVALGEIEEKLNANGRPVGQILKIEVISQTPSRRVGSLRITGTNGETVIAAKDFRIWIGGNRMRSTAFSLNVRDDTVEFYGKGWGHGVGLCQWGALGQSLIGRSYKSILNFYYPGATLTTLPYAQKKSS